MSLDCLRIATRNSPLALWQAEWVKIQLQLFYPQLEVELVPMTTKGDQLLATTLLKAGGKALFVKELEVALLEDRADIAVHSMKDVPIEFPAGLELSAICERADPRDAFVSLHYQCLEDLPARAIIGTSSLRRQSQLLALRPDLVVKPLRGNVNTRLKKLAAGEFAAIILAAAGLQRLELSSHIRDYFAVDALIPAAGQGALGIEARQGDADIAKLLQPLHNVTTAALITAERAVTRHLGGNCHVPIGAHAKLQANQLHLSAVVADPSGQPILKTQLQGDLSEAKLLGETAAYALLAQGAQIILQRLQ